MNRLLAQNPDRLAENEAEARSAQQALYELGLLDSDAVDGKFGPYSKSRLDFLKETTLALKVVAAGCGPETGAPTLAQVLRLLVSAGYMLENPRTCTEVVVGAATAFQVDLDRKRG